MKKILLLLIALIGLFSVSKKLKADIVIQHDDQLNMPNGEYRVNNFLVNLNPGELEMSDGFDLYDQVVYYSNLQDSNFNSFDLSIYFDEQEYYPQFQGILWQRPGDNYGDINVRIGDYETTRTYYGDYEYNITQTQWYGRDVWRIDININYDELNGQGMYFDEHISISFRCNDYHDILYDCIPLGYELGYYLDLYNQDFNFIEATQQAHEQGYNEGFNDGYNQTTEGATKTIWEIITDLFTNLSKILNIRLIGELTLGHIVGIVIFFSIFGFIIGVLK